ncbi:MAG: hypothetical protein C0594_14525 [Marinilabiliales bacterium]|nr:MAG: hypothetical protein C0594_14525 [Marinilabiliales bacterium]
MDCIDCPYKSQCFEKLNKSELQYINSSKKQVNYRKGETIYKQGSFSSHIMFIVEGYAKKYVEGKGGNDYTLNILKPNEFIGLSSLFCTKEYCYCSVSALTNTTVCLIKKEDFKKLIAENNSFAQEIIKWYCQNEEYIFKKFTSMNDKNTTGRLAEVLLYLSSKEYDDLDTHISRKVLSEFAGISLESTIRILSELKKDKIIATDGKKIEILDLDKLKSISKNG